MTGAALALPNVDHVRERERMVERQLSARGIEDRHVLEAMRAVPREAFVPLHLVEFAYEDSPLPIEEGQTISQPYIVAHMIEAAELKPGERALEIGTGSGYAAAVMARIAGEVFTIERHGRLADGARGRFAELGYRNIHVRAGDGSLGWPEMGPYDVILAAASGPSVPDVLRRQLNVGGRLVMPVGDAPSRQHLVKVTRAGEDRFREEDLGDVAFVPLIGAHGWRDEDESHRGRRVSAKRSVPRLIRDAAEPLPDIGSPEFARAFDRYAGAKLVLLGEASHGTAEFYRARSAITQRLVERHGFTLLAVEADWPDAAGVDRCVRDRPAPRSAEPPFRRFPTWMWRNAEFAVLIEWLRTHNSRRPAAQRVGFFGLDLYSLGASIRAVVDYLERVDPEAAHIARERYGCLAPWSRDPAGYGRMALSKGYQRCEAEAVRMLGDLLRRELDYSAADGADFLDAAQNARLVRSAEAYYRAMYYGGPDSWNLRDRHMFETLEALLARDPAAKAIVWAHNSHIGDASFTEMGLARGELNLGQLCRERYGDEAALIGFGTHTGTVAAANDWDGPMQVMRVTPSRPDSYEHLAHDSGVPSFLLDLREGQHEEVRYELLAPRLERFIGVIYRPDTERWSHYAQASLPRQFDGYVWFDETTAVTPLPTEQRSGVADTYPFGL